MRDIMYIIDFNNFLYLFYLARLCGKPRTPFIYYHGLCQRYDQWGVEDRPLSDVFLLQAVTGLLARTGIQTA
jgi:hypothetical protein